MAEESERNPAPVTSPKVIVQALPKTRTASFVFGCTSRQDPLWAIHLVSLASLYEAT